MGSRSRSCPRSRSCARHGHAHALSATASTPHGRCVALNSIFVSSRNIRFLSNSVALIADAGHNLGDVLDGLCVGGDPPVAPAAGRKIHLRPGRSIRYCALTNAVLLLVACAPLPGSVRTNRGAAARRGHHRHGGRAVGIVLTRQRWLLHGGSHDDLSRRSASSTCWAMPRSPRAC